MNTLRRDKVRLSTRSLERRPRLCCSHEQVLRLKRSKKNYPLQSRVDVAYAFGKSELEVGVVGIVYTCTLPYTSPGYLDRLLSELRPMIE